MELIENYEVNDLGEMIVNSETGDFYRYIDFTTIAEFLYQCVDRIVQTDLENELDFLSRYDVIKRQLKEFGGLAVNSVYFGSSGVEEIPSGYLMIELLTTAGALDHKSLYSVKSIVQPQYVKGCNNAHTFEYKGGRFRVNAQYDPVLKQEAESIHIDTIRLHHYWSRTEKFFREKKQTRRKRFRGEDPSYLESWHNQYMVRTDTTILQFVPILKEKLGMKYLHNNILPSSE